jgi:uncharacterized protein YqhQ
MLLNLCARGINMELIGGQAVVEGVMMVSPKKIAVSVRKSTGKIKSMLMPRQSMFTKVRHIAFVRGIFAMIEMLTIGMKALMWSSNESLSKDEQISSFGMGMTMLFSLVFGIGLFVALPLWVSHLITQQTFLFNLLDGLLRGVIFIGYILAISQFKDVRRLFEYHGAEHMAVHCHEAKKPLEVKHIRKFSPVHPRCGTAFIFLVLLVSIIIFSFIWSENWWMKFGLRLVLIPVIAGISYELLKLGARFPKNVFLKVLIMPGLWFQLITTREPDRGQIEVAIASLKKVL